MGFNLAFKELNMLFKRPELTWHKILFMSTV